jgi:hypothetical protein
MKMKATEKVRLNGVLKSGHKGPAVEVPFDPEDEWGVRQVVLWPGRKGYRVEVLLNGVRFRSAVVSRMRRFFVLVDESIARKAGLAVGGSATLTVWPDRGFEAKGATGRPGSRDGGTR